LLVRSHSAEQRHPFSCFYISHVIDRLSARCDWFKKFQVFKISTGDWLDVTSIDDVSPVSASRVERRDEERRIAWERLWLPSPLDIQ
ncbi:hypothetical protein XENOCAPTIV_030538, partial [Xenoophorus captivus]